MIVRVVEFFFGLFLLGCSGVVFLADFLAHSTARLRWIIEHRAVGYVLWSIPEAVCCLVAAIVGFVVLLHAIDPKFRWRDLRHMAR